jgi:hypothetical protein
LFFYHTIFIQLFALGTLSLLIPILDTKSEYVIGVIALPIKGAPIRIKLRNAGM